MRIALCQYEAAPDDISTNLQTVFEAMEADADMFVFPEMFLTGYASCDSDPDSMDFAIQSLCSATEETGKCVIVGGPEFSDGGTYNSAYAIRGSMDSYRKIHLPDFGPFGERSRFSPGSGPMMFDYGGFRFGLCICYDIFFPELVKTCSVGGADAIICISASPTTSKTAFESVLPARPVENTAYLVFVNNTGSAGDLTFFGGSRMVRPDGSAESIQKDEGMLIVEIDKETIEKARRDRPVLADTVSRIEW